MAKLVKEEFNSINEFLKTINSRPNNSVMEGENSSQSSDYDFTKTHSYAEAQELLESGYGEILPKIKNEMKLKIKGTTSQRRIPYNDIVGYIPNVPNALLGVPQSMINKTTIKNKIRTVSIIYSPTGNWKISADEFIKCGIVILNAINALELNGIRVTLKVACKCSEVKCQQALCCVKVKDYRDHLDLKKLAFPIAHPSFFRRFGFKWMETNPSLTDSNWVYGYGHTIPIKKFTSYPAFVNDKLIDIRDVKEMGYDYKKVIESFNLK